MITQKIINTVEALLFGSGRPLRLSEIKALLEIDLVKEAKGTFGYYDIFTKIHGTSSSEIEDIITKQIRNIPNVTATTTLSIIPEQDFEK